MIEEQVESGLRELMSAYQPGHMLGGTHRDEIDKRFTLRLNAPLTQFDTLAAKAYEATDSNNPGRQIYALVMDNTYNYRMSAIEKLAGTQHPHLINILAHATVFLTSLNEARQLIIIDKPVGKRLNEIIAQQRINQEHVIKDSILAPLCKAIATLRDKQIVHGRINTRNIYISDVLQLGECIGEPPGLSQDYLYEPIERMMSDDIGKGYGNEKVDVYAVAILAYELLYGLDHLRKIPKDEFIKKILSQGTYSLFATNRDFPDSLQDFFRGILADNPTERWGIDQLNQWINGKRFNMINSSGTNEAVRSITFDGEDFYSQKALANALHRSWREAVKDARQLKLDRWAEMGLHRPEVSERIARVMRSAGGTTERQNNDMLTRLICILDPTGPMRTQMLAMRPDGVGYSMAYMLNRGLNSELQQIMELIETDIGNYSADLAEPTGKTVEYSQFLWKLQRVKVHLKVRGLGFGAERVLYDLNPSLPCQSKMVMPYHITNINDLLRTLDTLAKKMAPDTQLLDKHIAAFIASKIDMGKEIRLLDLSPIPQLANDQELIMMKILAKAQQKNERIPMHGLCIWAAMRVEKMLDCIHNRAFRRKMKLQLKNVISNGQMSDLLNVIVNRDIASRDYEGFAQAIALHQINGQRIDRLKNPKVIEKMSRDLGGRIASIMSYTILGVTLYIVLSNHLSGG